MQTGLYVFLGLLAAYVLFVFWLVQTKRLEKWNLSLLLGIILMVRTQKGKGLIDAIARPKRLWNAIGDLGIVLTLSGMVVITLFFLWSVWFALQPDSGVPALGPTEILVIPGITPFVPLGYGLLALIVTLVVHEGGHGVLARANGLKLKSIGLLIAIVPVGAFVEPDDLDMKVASRRKRLRVFGAGPAVNLGFAALSLAGFALLMGSLAPQPGVHVATLAAGAPAEKGGLEPAQSIEYAAHPGATAWTPTPTWQDLVAFLNASAPGDRVTFVLLGGQTRNVTLESYWDALPDARKDDVNQGRATALCNARLEPDPADGHECAERLQHQAYAGIAPLLDSDVAFLSHPVGDGGRNLLFMFSLPLAELEGQKPLLSVYMPAFYATPFSPALFWPLANVLFWVFWINLAVGITNILPMMPLDGGHIFRDAVGGLAATVAPNVPPDRRERFVGRAAAAMSIVILVAFLLEILGPHLVGSLR